MFCMAALVADAAPNFVTKSMMKRRGLTDEQYELLWSMGAHPRIEVAAARDWVFRASRYTNVVEWLEVCGKTDDFAKLSHKLQGENFELVETNKAVKAENKAVKNENKAVMAENVVLVRKNEELEIDLADADNYRKAVKKIEKAARKDAKNLSKLRKDLEKYAKKAETEAFAELCNRLLELLPEGE